MLNGVVTLYHPTEQMINNILQYSSIIQNFFVIDNTPHPNSNLLHNLIFHSNIIYISNGRNMGIAYSLNIAVEQSKKQNCEWIILLDQDSVISKDAILSLYEFAITFPKKTLGIVSASYKHYDKHGPEQVLETITSGSLINVNICILCGKFEEKLYIDEVDNEYCLRISSLGYQIYRLNDIFFEHHLGNKQIVGNRILYNYPPSRYYYLIRNALYVANIYKKIYPDICRVKRKRVKIWIKNVFYEKKTLLKLCFILKGYWDYIMKNMGVCPWMQYK